MIQCTRRLATPPPRTEVSPCRQACGSGRSGWLSHAADKVMRQADLATAALWPGQRHRQGSSDLHGQAKEQFLFPVRPTTGPPHRGGNPEIVRAIHKG